MWDLIGGDTLEEFEGNISNLVEVFASGPFPLYQGRVERISMAELHSYDPLAGLNSAEHESPALYELKRIVQVIMKIMKTSPSADSASFPTKFPIK